MAAYELRVLCERDVALDNPRTLQCRALVRFLGVFGKLQRRTAMSDREVCATETIVFALHEPVFQRAFIHAINEIERSGSKLNGIIFLALMTPIVVIGAGRRHNTG